MAWINGLNEKDSTEEQKRGITEQLSRDENGNSH